MEATSESTNSKHGILALSIRELAVLYSSYMPLLEHGGLFIPTPKAYAMGEQVFMLLSLMEEAQPMPLTGTVVWITPAAAEGNRAQGIGVHFNARDNPAKPKIEQYLAGISANGRVTHTL